MNLTSRGLENLFLVGRSRRVRLLAHSMSQATWIVRASAMIALGRSDPPTQNESLTRKLFPEEPR